MLATLDLSMRWRYFWAISVTSLKRPSADSSRIGSSPSSLNFWFATTSSFSASSCRGFATCCTSAPKSLATISAMSRTRAVSATWLRISTLSPFFGGLATASSMQRQVSEMWMKARVWPPVPYTVSGMPEAACIRKRLSTVPYSPS